MKTTQIKLMPSDALRLHFWNATENKYIVTDCISCATKYMGKDFYSSVATNQTTDILPTDIELYFL